MRLPPEKLAEITGRKRARAQADWFRDYLGVVVPCDRQGPIVTVPTYEALVARACGLRADVPTGLATPVDRPKLHLRSVRR
jgi:hypothetical protein